MSPRLLPTTSTLSSSFFLSLSLSLFPLQPQKPKNQDQPHEDEDEQGAAATSAALSAVEDVASAALRKEKDDAESGFRGMLPSTDLLPSMEMPNMEMPSMEMPSVFHVFGEKSEN